MKFNQKDVLELRLSGRGMTPTALKATEVGELISAYEGALLHVIQRNHPEVNIDSVVISLVAIEQNSAHYCFLPNIKDVVFGAATIINNAIMGNNLPALPYKTVEALEEIWKFTKRKNCQAEFVIPALPTATITPENPVQITEAFFYEGETTIYGRIERVGGAIPRVRIKLDNDQVLFLDITETIAKKLANRLYENVVLKGLAKWRKENFMIEDFKIEDIQYFEATIMQDAIESLKETVGTAWDNVADIESYIYNLRYEKEEF